MKIFDIHIGVSDSVIVTGKNPFIKGSIKSLLPNQFDLIRAKKGGLEIFCGMMCPVVLKKDELVLPEDLKKEINKHIKVYEVLEKKGKAKIIRKKEDFNNEGLKILIGLEGVYFIKKEDDLEFLEEIIERGVKIIGPMWNFNSNLFTKAKVTKLGIKFLEICQRHKIVIDLAHSEKREFYTIMENYNGLIINSHTNMYVLNKNKRNIQDKQIRAIIKRKGIIGFTFVGAFVGGNSIENVSEHVSKFVDEYGMNNIVLGSDFDGMERVDLVKGLEDVSTYQNFVTFMGKKINNASMKKIMFENAFNFFKSSY